MPITIDLTYLLLFTIVEPEYVTINHYYYLFARDYSQSLTKRINLRYYNLCGIDTLTFTSLATI